LPPIGHSKKIGPLNCKMNYPTINRLKLNTIKHNKIDRLTVLHFVANENNYLGNVINCN